MINKYLNIQLFSTAISFVFLCDIVSAQPPGEWTWMHGLNTFDSPGVFGTKGVANPANMPPAVYEAAGEWKDAAGNLYFFGGLGLGYYSDIWKYDVSINQWTWINGPGIPDQLGVYGTQGIPAPANHPGGRAYASVTWVDNAGNFWLFGGTGYNAVSAGNMMNELWKYNVATNQWAWMSGPNNINASPGSYGTMGVASPTNLPPARAECSASWVDNTGNLWFYGGNGGINLRLGDMWKYDVTTNQWTWMSGSNTFNAPAVYGTLNLSAAANTPGGRWAYASWTDLTGKFWLFGGTLGSAITNQNDMWLYDPAINQWTWKGGNAAASYGTKCVPAPTNLPPKKYENRYRTRDACGNFWMFGANNLTSRWGNDLWYFNVTTEQWTWISGDNNTVPPAPAVFGTITVSNPANKPGGRYGGTMWADNAGNLWIFGGMGSSFSSWNDLWRYVPPRAFTQSQVNATSCNPCDGSATVTFTCALSNYSYVWSNGSSTLNTSNSTNTVTGLCPGTYTVSVTSSCNQTQTASFLISGTPCQNCNLTAQFIKGTANCSNCGCKQWIMVNGNGGTSPYSYTWSASGGIVNRYRNNLCPGTYTVNIKDKNGCSVNVNLTAP